MQKAKAFLFLVRFPNLFIIALTQFFISYFIVRNTLDYKFLALIVSTVLVAASGNIINDYFDVRFDNINKPNEIWVGRIFKRRTILILHWVICVIAVGIGFYSSIYVAVIDVLCVALLWFYSQKLKCIPLIGNIIVAFLTSIVVLIIALKYQYFDNVIWLLIYFSFLINIIREITKDIEDIRGDYSFDCKTLATKYGILITKNILILLEVIFLVTFLILLYFVSLKFQILISIVFIPLSIVLLILTKKAHKKSHFKLMSRIEKLIILLGIISISLLSL